MKSPIFGKEKLLYFPQKSGIVPIFKKSPSSYISYFCHHAPWFIVKAKNSHFLFFIRLKSVANNILRSKKVLQITF